MTLKKRIPITPEDLVSWGSMIGINEKDFCPYCDGELKTKPDEKYSANIFYKCEKCNREFQKTNYRDFRNKEGNYFVLREKI